MRTVSKKCNIPSRLKISKLKVAPISTKHSIARLQLWRAVLTSQLYSNVVKSINIKAETTFWTDSIIAFHWLQSSPQRWKTFVANRVSSVQQSTLGCHWRHVPGVQNHADSISRECSVEELIGNSLWWQGPERTIQQEVDWPQLKSNNIDQIAISDEPTYEEALTPGHFLTESHLQGIPSLDWRNVPQNRKNNWREGQERVQHFWDLWHTEYL